MKKIDGIGEIIRIIGIAKVVVAKLRKIRKDHISKKKQKPP